MPTLGFATDHMAMLVALPSRTSETPVFCQESIENTGAIGVIWARSPDEQKIRKAFSELVPHLLREAERRSPAYEEFQNFINSCGKRNSLNGIIACVTKGEQGALYRLNGERLTPLDQLDERYAEEGLSYEESSLFKPYIDTWREQVFWEKSPAVLDVCGKIIDNYNQSYLPNINKGYFGKFLPYSLLICEDSGGIAYRHMAGFSRRIGILSSKNDPYPDFSYPFVSEAEAMENSIVPSREILSAISSSYLVEQAFSAPDVAILELALCAMIEQRLGVEERIRSSQQLDDAMRSLLLDLVGALEKIVRDAVSIALSAKNQPVDSLVKRTWLSRFFSGVDAAWKQIAEPEAVGRLVVSNGFLLAFAATGYGIGGPAGMIVGGQVGQIFAGKKDLSEFLQDISKDEK